MSASTRQWPRRGLYLLTPDRHDTARLVAELDAALSAGVAMLQYRNKTADTPRRREQLEATRRLCHRYNVPLIVNDDVALAREFAAAGVHLGEHDANVAAARAALGPDAIIGASCYDDPARAEAAVRAGASYVAFGAFFASSTKPKARHATLELLRAPCRVPKVAIGGITADNARPLLDAGAHLVAVIGDVFDTADIAAAVRRYAPLFQDRP